MKVKFSVFCAYAFATASLLSGFAGMARADTLTGQIAVSITLTDSCAINGSVPTGGESYGTIDFGTHSTLFTSADGVVSGGSGSGIEIVCAASAFTPTLTILNGSNDSFATGGHLYAMSNGAGKYVSYDIYSDVGRSAVIPKNTAFFTSANDGSVESVMLYARAFGDNRQTL